MSTDYKFEGWGAFDEKSIEGNLKWFEYEPRKWDEDCVDIKILYCGVCASDLHTMSGGWSPPPYPQVVGHEIVGEIVRVGKDVKHLKVGDIGGVGAQNDSCMECDYCKTEQEPYCPTANCGTYAGIYKRGAGKGDKSYGGYANYHRAPAHFVCKIPEGLDPALAAPMMCGGTTMYSPLKQYGAGTPKAMDVGIIGIGGLGHFGLLFAKAMGARVTAISHSESKKADAEKMGATNFIATHKGGEEDFKPYAKSLDLIICTTNDVKMPLAGYLSLLKVHGHLVLVGIPEAPLPQIPAVSFIAANAHLTGSAIGGPAVISEMLELAAKQTIHPWIEKRSLDRANETVVDMHNSKARYRYVLVNEKNGGEL